MDESFDNHRGLFDGGDMRHRTSTLQEEIYVVGNYPDEQSAREELGQ